MKKLALVLLLAGTAHAESVIVSKDADRTISYYEDSVEVLKDGNRWHVSYWMKHEYNSPMTPPSGKTFTTFKVREKIDCYVSKSAMTAFRTYTRNHLLVDTWVMAPDGAPNWNPIEPGTVQQTLFRKFCKV